MRVLLQRVKQAWVRVDGVNIASMGLGILGLVGFGRGDGPSQMAWMADKVSGIRIFPDSQGKMMATVADAGGEILLVPQFTLYADLRRGRRPDFNQALPGAEAAHCYRAFVEQVRQQAKARVQSGQFGADMEVGLVNWGPVTLLLERENEGEVGATGIAASARGTRRPGP